MAGNATYTTLVPAEGATKADAYLALSTLLSHLPGFGVDLVSLSFSGKGVIHIVLSGAISKAQLAHVGLQP